MTDSDDRHDLDEAKQKLSEARGRPFDVDKILAQNRAKEERTRIAEKKAKAKLEETVRVARERRHELRAQEVEKESEALDGKRLAFEAAKSSFKKKDGDGHGK